MGSAKDLSDFISPTSITVSPDSVPITPDDNTDQVGGPFRSLRANAAGTISVITARGNTRTMNFLAGETRNVCVTRVRATGTSATGIEGMP